MKILVKFYKSTGKWYEEDIVDLDDGFRLHTEGLYDELCKKQSAVTNPREFIMVVQNLPEDEDNIEVPFFEAIMQESLRNVFGSKSEFLTK